MKQVKKPKFSSELVPMILSGEKTTTWRLFDEKNLSAGDELELVDAGTQKVFALARIVSVREKNFGELSPEDWQGHEAYSSEKQLYETYGAYYGAQVGAGTRVKIVKFNLVN